MYYVTFHGELSIPNKYIKIYNGYVTYYYQTSVMVTVLLKLKQF